MSSRNAAPPRLPLPIGGVTEMYMTDLVNALDFFITQTTNPGEGRNTKLVFTEMPTSDVGLEQLVNFATELRVFDGVNLDA